MTQNRRHSIVPMWVLAIIIAVTTFCGCSAMSTRGPAVTLTDASITDVTLLETEIRFKVRLENHSPDELTIHGASYTIDLNDTEIGSGSTGERLVIPPYGRATQSVTIGVSNFTFVNQIRALVEEKRFDYEIDATFSLDRLGMQRAHTEKTGHFGLDSLGGSTAPPSTRFPSSEGRSY